MKDVLIWCDTKEKLKKVARKLKGDGFNITDVKTIWNSYGAESVLSVHTKHKCITHCSRDWYERRDYAAPITADEFLSKNKNPSIVIFRRDRSVIAKDIVAGNEGIAKCSPDDEFVFKIGASIALARLMAKTSEVLTDDVRAEWKKVLGIKGVVKVAYTDVDRNFKVGDRVEIKTWDEMEKAYGLNPWGSIFHGGTSFSVPMKHLCGRTATITEIINDKFELDFDNKSGDVFWYYMDWMLKKSNKPKPEVTEIEVGDTVRITNNGYSYTTFIDWIHDNVTDFRNAVLFDYNVIPKNGTVCTVIKKGKHIIEGNMLYYVKTDNDKCYLICEGGIEKV